MFFTVKMYFSTVKMSSSDYDGNRNGIIIATGLVAPNVTEAVQEGYVTLTAFVPYYKESTISMDIRRTDEYGNPIENVSMENPINCWMSNTQIRKIVSKNDKWRDPQLNVKIEIHMGKSKDYIAKERSD